MRIKITEKTVRKMIYDCHISQCNDNYFVVIEVFNIPERQEHIDDFSDERLKLTTFEKLISDLEYEKYYFLGIRINNNRAYPIIKKI